MGQISGPLTPCCSFLGEGGEDLSGFFRLDRDVMRSWVLMPALCQGAFMEGDERPQNDKVACSSIVWVLPGWYPCYSTIWRFICCILEEANLTRRVKRHGPKMNRSRKSAKGPRRRVTQENQEQTLVCDVSVYLGMRRCKNWGSWKSLPENISLSEALFCQFSQSREGLFSGFHPELLLGLLHFMTILPHSARNAHSQAWKRCFFFPDRPLNVLFLN